MCEWGVNSSCCQRHKINVVFIIGISSGVVFFVLFLPYVRANHSHTIYISTIITLYEQLHVRIKTGDLLMIPHISASCIYYIRIIDNATQCNTALRS